MTVKRPIVRYHGGKWLLAPWIVGNFPDHRCYVEPFGGGGSVLLRKSRAYAEIYNDLDADIVNVFRCARDHGQELQRLLELTPFARDEFLLSYERCDDPVEWARRCIARSFMGFGADSFCITNGRTGFRSNSNRSGTTPAHDWKNYAHAFEFLIDRLKGVVIENRDAMQVMAAHDSVDTLHYVDPPYVLDTRSDARHGYYHEMTDQDHEALATFLHGLKGMVILSGYPGPLYDRLFGDWRRVERKALADGARERREVLWISPNVRQGTLL